MHLLRIRSGNLLFIALTCITAGEAAQSLGEKSVTLERAAELTTLRAYVLRYTATLPNYTCTQLTRQMITRPAALLGGLSGSPLRIDVIEEQLSFLNHREVRTVTKINDVRPRAAGQDQIGTLSRGEFGSLLDTIFDAKSGADIRWDRTARVDGRPVYVFAYNVPQSSGYVLTGPKGQIQVAFEGSVYADSQTGAVVRIEMKGTGIPARSEYRSLNLTLEYKPAKIGATEYLLPSRFNLHYEMTGSGAIIGAEYKSYRRFSADSTVKFDADSGDTNVAGALRPPAAQP